MAVIAGIRQRGIPIGVRVGTLTLVGSLDVCARLPLHVWASLLICGGLATQSVRLVRPRPLAFLRLVRRSVPFLAGIVLTIMLVTISGRAWSEHRAVSSLAPAPPAARNVLLIVWDTVRAGNLSLYGHGRPTTPNLERLAGRGVRFDLAFSTSSWTLPSHASLFTGRWPHELGADWKRPLRDDVPTLAEYLSSRIRHRGLRGQPRLLQPRDGSGSRFRALRRFPARRPRCPHPLRRAGPSDRNLVMGLRRGPSCGEVFWALV